MKTRFAMILAVSFGIATLTTPTARSSVILEHPNPRINHALKEGQTFLEPHTGMVFKDQVKVHLLSRKDFKVESDRECEASREAIRKQLGIPVIFDLIDSVDAGENQLKSLLSGASTGAYSYEAREIRLPDDTDIDMVTFVHEMHHALIDQNFFLAKIRQSAGGDDDIGTAIHTFIEGSAKLAEATYEDWSETRDRAKAIPSRDLLTKIHRSALGEIRKLYAGKTVADRRFTVNADIYLAYTYGLAHITNRALREAGGGWHDWYKTLFDDGLPMSTREVLALGAGEKFVRERIDLDLKQFRDRLASQPEWKLVNDSDDIRFGELYARLYLRQSIDAPRGGIVETSLGWTGDRVIAIQSSRGGVGFGGTAALVMAFSSEVDAQEARKQFGRNVVPGRDLDRMSRQVGRVVVFRVGQGFPDPLFEAITAAVSARPMPALPPTLGLLTRLASHSRDDSAAWPEIERLMPEVKGDRSAFFEGLTGWVFLERSTPALRHSFDRSIEAGGRLSSREFRAGLRDTERIKLIDSAIKGLDDPEVSPACRFNSLRFAVAEFSRLSTDQKTKAIQASESLGPRGLEIAEALRQAEAQNSKGNQR